MHFRLLDIDDDTLMYGDYEAEKIHIVGGNLHPKPGRIYLRPVKTENGVGAKTPDNKQNEAITLLHRCAMRLSSGNPINPGEDLDDEIRELLAQQPHSA